MSSFSTCSVITFLYFRIKILLDRGLVQTNSMNWFPTIQRKRNSKINLQLETTMQNIYPKLLKIRYRSSLGDFQRKRDNLLNWRIKTNFWIWWGQVCLKPCSTRWGSVCYWCSVYWRAINTDDVCILSFLNISQLFFNVCLSYNVL